MLPELPAEILYLIFEFAACNEAATASSIDRLNHSWRTRTGSLLHHTVVLHTAQALIGFIESIRSAPITPEGIRRPRQFYADTVRYMSILHVRVPYHYIQVIYEYCTGITTLEVDAWAATPHRDKSLRIRDLLIPYFPADEAYLRSSVFTELTHLWITQPVLSDQMPTTFPPKLEYLAVPFRALELQKFGRTQWFRHLDTYIPNLRLMIINFIETYQYITTISHDDGSFCHDKTWGIFLSAVQDPRILMRLVKGPYRLEARRAREKGISLWDLAIQEGVPHHGDSGHHPS
ncbi:hypothetical protein FRC17_007785 [Serendipita sp. 399]|nr:hypothetical protein FRC17_007785 [Serendipita sp. 399]